MLARCKICGDDNLRIIWEVRNRCEFILCPHCEFLSRDSRYAPPPEREQAEYLTHRNTLDNCGYVEMFRSFLREAASPFLLPEFNAGKIKALDFGCGPGDCVLAHLLKEEFCFQTDTYDPYFAPGEEYRSRYYHLITCTEVAEHLSNPLDLLQQLRERLEPGGVLALMTLFHMVIPGRRETEETFRHWWYRRDPTHISFFRPRTFETLAERLNMEIVFLDNVRRVSFRKPRQ